MADFLNPYFIGLRNGFGLFSKRINTHHLIFTGLFNAFLYFFYYFLILVLIPTALLICMENTFWNVNGDSDFVKLFKKSFELYVKSGRRKMTERDFKILRNEQGEISAQAKDFNGKFYEFIVDHYLRKFHCFYLHSIHLIVFTY